MWLKFLKFSNSITKFLESEYCFKWLISDVIKLILSLIDILILSLLKKLNEIEKCCKSNKNLMPAIIDAALQYATLGEIVDAMKNHFGEWNEKTII